MTDLTQLKPAFVLIATLLLVSCNLQQSESSVSSNTSTTEPNSADSAQLPVSRSNILELALTHQTDFLTGGQFTHLYPSFSVNKRKKLRNKVKQSGYTHIYIYIMNQNDYRGPAFDFYDDIERYTSLLKELVDDGIEPVVWLAPDDAPDLHKKYTVERLIRTWKQVIPAIDHLVSSYVLGLEMDEYWNETQQNALGLALNELTPKPIFVHLRTSKWKPVLNSWATGIIYQYGFGKTAAQITEETLSMLSLLAEYPEKVFIAGEYSIRQSEEISGKLGDSALRAGANGFGNGGTPFR